MTRLRAAMFAFLGIAACDGEGRKASVGDAGPDGIPIRCTSGVIRDPNESESAEMMPGHACNECHAEQNAASGEGDAPIFAFAGTVFSSAHQPDDCVDSVSEGAQVTVIDAVGKVFIAPVNHSGNFSLEADGVVLPLQAKVTFQGRERRMVAPQSSGDCNVCHTASGHLAAPGRIVLP